MKNNPHKTHVSIVINLSVQSQSDYENTASRTRAKWLFDAADWVDAHSNLFVDAIVLEGVKTLSEAQAEVRRASGVLRLSSEEATRIIGSTIDFGQDIRGEGRIGWVKHKPIGVVLGITPFNDPLNLVAHKVGPAIAAGNAVIIKPHPNTPTPAKLLKRAFDETSLPNGLFQVMPGGDDVGKALVESPDISMVSFTGGRHTGRAIAQAAVGKPLALELGGVAVTIIASDADLEVAVPRLVSGMFAAAGQNCLHVQRVLASEEIFNELSSLLVKHTKQLSLGPSGDAHTQVGRIVNDEAIARCEAWVSQAVQSGGRILIGGGRTSDGYLPTIVAGAGATSKICTKEIFGPVTSLEKFVDIDDAIEKAASSGPALAAAIFTRSLDLPFKLQKLSVGQVIVNDSTDFRIDAMPFGGNNSAGIGREGVQSAIQAMTEQQVICFANS
jgi:acyl-CoA reductase-like NAD-dependent aldehyde dehydrogenase